MKKKNDLVDVIEAVYTETEADDAWLARVLEAAAPLTDRGLGAHAFFYDARVYPLRMWNMCESGKVVMPAPAVRAALEGATPEYVEQSWKRLHCATASEVPGWDAEPSRRRFFDSVGINDVLAINGYDPSGVGCFIGTPLPKLHRLRRAERARYERIATHLASGFRLRRRVREAEAILSTSGKVLDASTSESKERAARESLCQAVREIERARGAMRRRDPEGALLSWRALVQARWSLVDHFESDGKRLVVAMANEPAAPPVKTLTTRERNVLELAIQGHTTKLIAYELGLSDSTVRVLLMRAARTLGAKTRDEAIERYRRLRGTVNND